MIVRVITSTLVATLFAGGSPALVSAQTNACSLLSSEEVASHITRGRSDIGEPPTATSHSGGKGFICQYNHGQVGLWKAPNAEQNLEVFMKAWKADNAKRTPVSGVGDRAWIAFPVPENKYKDRVAFLVAHVGQQVVTVALFAHDGQADGTMGQVCRGDQSKMRPREREDCKKILADKSETQESLQPAVIELAKVLVEKVRAGKG
jgi:hypothetical protein